MKKHLLPFLLVLFLADASAQIFVKQNAAGANNGSSWADAYTDLKTALTAAVTDDEIWVAAGVYKPAEPGGTPGSSFILNKKIKLLGGFAGTETAAEQRDPVANLTVLSGDLNGNDLDDDFLSFRSDNVQHVINISATATTGTLVDGFTIQGGQADGANLNNGAGISCLGTPTIRRCVFRQNFCFGNGAGLYASGVNAQGLVVEVCRFENNSAMNGGGSAGGGGMAVSNIKGIGFTVKNAVFANNTADWVGGLEMENSNGSVEGSTFSNNSTFRHGGGLRAYFRQNNNGLHVEVRDCTFENNQAAFGGGMYVLIFGQNNSVEVVNSTFIGNSVETPPQPGWDNSYGGLGAAIANTASNASISVDSCLFEGNSCAWYYSACGIESDAANTEATISNSIFRGNVNTFYSATAGVAGYGAASTIDAVIENCLFENNISVAAAGLYLGQSDKIGSYEVRNCRFLNNQASYYGGALTLFSYQNSELDFNVQDCEFEGNSALRSGAIWIATSSDKMNAHFNRCVIRNNDALVGSALGVEQLDLGEYIMPDGSVALFENCLIEGNTSSVAIALDSFPGFRLINSTIAHNHGGILLSDSSGISLQNTILYNPGYPEYLAATSDVTFTSRAAISSATKVLPVNCSPATSRNSTPSF